MYKFFPKSFFVTGTDTSVGKTVISAILMSGLSALYWKPIQCGTEQITDTDWIRQVTGLSEHCFFPEAYRLTKPLSPHAAAEAEGVRIKIDDLYLPKPDALSHVIVEGAGGVLVPINKHQYMVDIMKQLDLPVCLVSRSALGTINHTLLSLLSLRQRGLEVMGVVINGPKNTINRNAIKFYGNTQIIAEIEVLPEITQQTLFNSFSKNFFKLVEEIS